jgi:hypothetical protein
MTPKSLKSTRDHVNSTQIARRQGDEFGGWSSRLPPLLFLFSDSYPESPVLLL